MLRIEKITIGNALYGEMMRTVHLNHGPKKGNTILKAMYSFVQLCLHVTLGSALKFRHSNNTNRDSLTFGQNVHFRKRLSYDWRLALFQKPTVSHNNPKNDVKVVSGKCCFLINVHNILLTNQILKLVYLSAVLIETIETSIVGKFGLK